MPVIRISREIAERLKRHKDSPLDTIGSVVERLLDQVDGYEPTPSKGAHTMRIAIQPKMRAARNLESWHKIETTMSAKGSATYEDLVNVCSNHKHEAGGRGFVEYCIDNGWLEYCD